MADATSIVRYYRADTPAIRSAWAAYQDACAAVVAEATTFAARFAGAKPVFATGHHGRRFHGLTFDPPMSTDIWTHPDRKGGNVQSPRARIADKEARKNSDRVEALRGVSATYANHKPTRTANIDSVFEALGTDWGTLLFCGYSIVERDGALFVRTLADLGAPCVEVTGSEFQQAARKAAAPG